jgi:hypothetical protein
VTSIDSTVALAARRSRPTPNLLPGGLERLATRTTNPFGKRPDERAKFLADKADVEPLLRAGADLVLETTEPVEVTVQRLLDLLTP